MHNQPQLFHPQAEAALADQELRANFRGAMDYLRDKRQAAFTDPDEEAAIRDRAEAIRRRCLSKLPALLEQLEANCIANGIRVHWAEDAAQANAIFTDIIQSHGGTLAVKGKSMVSEEIELNHQLTKEGISCLESDMGEYIVQLGDETPSHIIMPAIHKNKRQVADLFAEHVPGFEHTLDVDRLIQTGRNVLRQKFREAQVGISGVNFAVAETGTLCLVENEGNGRMCTTVPEVHIAVTGIEKVVELLADVPPLFSALTRSATGQAITTYFNMISGPRKDDELDGPKEVHLVLLDNGRSQAFVDEEMRQTLQCIRCGACMNHCPVYTRIGGHAYGTVYPGPIGKIISPHLMGLEATRELPTASSLCGACGEVCPVRIPIPHLLQRLRREAKQEPRPGVPALRGQGAAKSKLEAFVWRSFGLLTSKPALYRLLSWCATRCRSLIPAKLGPWTRCRTAPKPAARTLRVLMAERNK
ncbi:LutB/LldF family L-lactate oxidation iron-sulfur protein [Zobellella aerophila]|uniref:LutB/LldF family L-lactate oxidation iron-sulfur protein n=1 Tax=Zobellella aerophila TaxID=870480 RepID=A0ABP6WID3_9GAMM